MTEETIKPHTPLSLPKEILLDITWQISNIALEGAIITVLTVQHEGFGRKDLYLSADAVAQLIQGMVNCQRERQMTIEKRAGETVQ